MVLCSALLIRLVSKWLIRHHLLLMLREAQGGEGAEGISQIAVASDLSIRTLPPLPATGNHHLRHSEKAAGMWSTPSLFTQRAIELNRARHAWVPKGQPKATSGPFLAFIALGNSSLHSGTAAPKPGPAPDKGRFGEVHQQPRGLS